MRIAILTSSYPRFLGDGTAPFVKSIAEEMSKIGHEVEVVAPYDPEVQFYDTKGIKIHRFKYTIRKQWHIMGHGRAMDADVRLRPLALFLLPGYIVAAIITLWQVTRHQQTEIIYVHWVLPNGPIAALVAKLQRIRFILSLHGSDMFVAQRNSLFGLVARWVFSQASAVTACSPELRDQAIAFGAPEDTKLIAWGADPNIFKPAVNRQALRAKYGWGEELVIITLGRLVNKKGFNTLIQAIPDIKAKFGAVKLVIGGDGLLSTELKGLAENLGIKDSVNFLGRVSWEEVTSLFAAADIFVLPSVRDSSGNLDGLPTVLLEAMGCGLAIIASEIGGVPLVIRDHENGLLVPPGSVNELTYALVSLINQSGLRQQLGEAARKSVLDEFNWENVARRITKLISSQKSEKSPDTRIGSLYRQTMLTCLGFIDSVNGKVLDVGCYDGLILSKLEADFKVGIDLHPIHKYSNISLVQGDARFLPFRSNCFNRVYALDVIEHIIDDEAFAHELIRALDGSGQLILTTPSANIRLNPPFLTTWISRKWGHIYKLGYTNTTLRELFNNLSNIIIKSWNAPVFRLLYPVLRLLQPIFPRLIDKWVRIICLWDFQHLEGQHGFQIMVAGKSSDISKV